jgi:cytochrome oxidase Cu insertion factor (SCO1/SenC/PrrC family)
MSSSAPPQLISISIDPEYDDPARLQKYAEVFHARGEWQF